MYIKCNHFQVECVTLDSSDEDNGDDDVSSQPQHKNKRRRISTSEEEEDAASTSGKLPVVALYRIQADKFIRL